MKRRVMMVLACVLTMLFAFGSVAPMFNSAVAEVESNAAVSNGSASGDGWKLTYKIDKKKCNVKSIYLYLKPGVTYSGLNSRFKQIADYHDGNDPKEVSVSYQASPSAWKYITLSNKGKVTAGKKCAKTAFKVAVHYYSRTDKQWHTLNYTVNVRIQNKF